ncbi:MAG: SCO1/SenC family protein/methylamine utilization protein MauG [Rhodocyclaceae bacterium]|nr:MAG: SCO1/SenC family protein/methylamine utilization protein MauG [Rhodocyclaceae bacterium]TND01264.1 MAG: SCO1/SenC family protein/methylamine utilization protein MauG [Rhodocyclaceae bacterium]
MKALPGTLLLLWVLALSACERREPDNIPVGLAPPQGLPVIPLPPDSPLTQARIELGRTLFMDRRLSHNNTLSCAMCHVPEQGFTSNELGTAIGLEGQTIRRNSPTVYNVAYVEQLFHDGREFSLENQAWGPLLAGNEMANPSIGYVIEKIRVLPEYAGRFEKAFGGRGPDVLTVGQALAAYQRTLVSGNSRFDRWHYGKEQNALNAEEQAGFRLFSGKAGCSACHVVGEKHALLSDNRFHNTGIGYANSMGLPKKHRVQLAPGVFVEVEDKALDSFEQPQPDVGRYEVTLDPADSWAYRTPSLRNVALTSPYMHDGSLPTLEEVIEFYDRGGIDNPQKNPLLKPLALSATEKRALAAFLKSLTGDNVQKLVTEARAAQPADTPPEKDPASTYRRSY